MTVMHMISACGRDPLNVLLFARAFKTVGRIYVVRNVRTAVGYSVGEFFIPCSFRKYIHA